MAPLASHRHRLGFLSLLSAGVLAASSSVAQEMRGSAGLMPLEDKPPTAVAESASEGGAEPSSPETAESTATPVPGSQGLENVQSSTGQAFGEKPTGVAYSSIFRDTGAPYYSVDPPSNLDAQVKTEHGSGNFSLGLPSYRLGVPSSLPFLHRGFAPTDAHLKLGPLYLRFGYLSGAVLASDNINLSETNREGGCIAAVRLGVTAIAQLTEGLQLSVAGTVTYLPLVSKVGIGFSGLNPALSPFLLGLDYVPILSSQLSYETNIASWPVIFADDFRVSQGRISDQTRDDFYRFDEVAYGERFEDRAGRYSFSAPNTTSIRTSFHSSDNRNSNIDNLDVTYLSNVISVSTARLLPSEAQLNARAYREDISYINSGQRGLPTWREVASVEVDSLRENLRFKPFMGYEVMKTSQMDSGVDQQLYAGFRGPITDQLNIYSRIGYFRSFRGDNDLLWRLELKHFAGPYTTESLIYSRELSGFHDEIIQSLAYSLQQVLGPDLDGVLFARLGRVENQTGDLNSHDEFRTGLLLSYRMSPRTQMRLGATYAETENSQNDFTNRTWTVRYDLNYQATDSLTARLIYQYQKNESSIDRNSYYENLVYLLITKTFQ